MDRVERKIEAIIDAHAKELIEFAEDIYRHPEEGFYDERTAAKVADFLRGLNLNVHTGLARTGVRADWMEQDGPNVTIIGELERSVAGSIRWRILSREWHTHADTTHSWRL